MCGDRVFHLHRLQDHHQVAGRDLLSLLDGNLHHGALHRRGHRVTGRRGAAVGAPLAWLGLFADRADRVGGRTVGQRQVTRQRHLEPPAADLHYDLLPRQSLVLVDGLAASERLDGVVPLGLNPAGVHRETVVVADERRVGHHGAVERDDGGQPFDVEFVQRAA